ncbi:MAG: hypothetical protein ACE5G0_14910 [Rhodothermales bacterium]
MPNHRACGRVLGGLFLLWMGWGGGTPVVQAQHAPARFADQALRLRRALSPSTNASLRRPAAPHYDVVALRVAFQPDTTRFTTGDGTFEGELYDDGLRPTVDPLPHDAAYFQAHLAFLEDYVAKVSDGQTQVTPHLVPEVVHVSQPMAAYSPTGPDAGSDAELVKLGALIEEAWQTADQISSLDLSGFDPERTAFVLFHAGVGRDIELLGTTLDKTPQDLPSIFFDEQALARLGVEAGTFRGIPVRHTLVLPRTETRRGFNFISDEPFLLELSTNGLLAASFFNFLGVPDLFNVETGDPAIGPFGLMDPLGIFAYNGLFPPEPSAWTKYFLGWVEPLDLRGNEPISVTLPAAGLQESPAVARAPVSPVEYFLVENRHRDPEGDGLVLRIWQGGQIVEQRVQNGDEDFTRFNIEGFTGGVVVGVDTYDWALPGGVDEDGNILNGGILIWHIDERRLEAGLQNGGVNTDPERRAIDLEEADSAQDLGFPPDNPLGPAADQGTPFDFYFLDNPITTITATGQRIQLYENRFGPGTVPNSNSNEGGSSFVVLEDFSAPGSEMTFVYRREGAEGITPRVPFAETDLGSPISPGGSISFEPAQPDRPTDLVMIHNGQRWIACNPPTLWTIDDTSGAFTLEDNRYLLRPAVTVSGEGISVFLDCRIAAPFDVLRVTRVAGPSGFQSMVRLPLAGNQMSIIGPLVALGEGVEEVLYFGLKGENGVTYLVRVREGEEAVVEETRETFETLAAVGSDELALVGREGVYKGDGEMLWTYTLPSAAEMGQAVFGRDVTGGTGAVPVISNAELLFLRADQTVERIDVSGYAQYFGEGEADLSPYPVLVDLDDDGHLDVLTTYGSRLWAFSQDGALVRGFPIPLSAQSVMQPLVAELSESGAWSVVVASTDGYVYAYDLGDGGRLVPGFPLAVGARIEATPLLQGNNLYAVSSGGSLRSWTLESIGQIWWGQHLGDARNRSFVTLDTAPEPQPSPQAGGLIVEAETYNWPNPIRDGTTYLRCKTSEDATVRITIIDAAGSLIDEVELDLHGGTPAEHLWQTPAASGVYFARVTATSSSGRTATHLIKMAVIR